MHDYGSNFQELTKHLEVTVTENMILIVTEDKRSMWPHYEYDVKTKSAHMKGYKKGMIAE